MFDILVSPDLMKNKSELILKHLIYLEKHLYLPFTAKTLKALFTTASPFPCLSIILQPLPPTHTHALSEASGGFPVSKLNDNMDAYAAFCTGLPTALGSVGDSPPSVSCPCSQHATLSIFLSWWFLLSLFCCLLFDLHHLLLPVSEVSILVFFLFLLF